MCRPFLYLPCASLTLLLRVPICVLGEGGIFKQHNYEVEVLGYGIVVELYVDVKRQAHQKNFFAAVSTKLNSGHYLILWSILSLI